MAVDFDGTALGHRDDSSNSTVWGGRGIDKRRQSGF